MLQTRTNTNGALTQFLFSSPEQFVTTSIGSGSPEFTQLINIWVNGRDMMQGWIQCLCGGSVKFWANQQNVTGCPSKNKI